MACRAGAEALRYSCHVVLAPRLPDMLVLQYTEHFGLWRMSPQERLS